MIGGLPARSIFFHKNRFYFANILFFFAQNRFFPKTKLIFQLLSGGWENRFYGFSKWDKNGSSEETRNWFTKIFGLRRRPENWFTIFFGLRRRPDIFFAGTMGSQRRPSNLGLGIWDLGGRGRGVGRPGPGSAGWLAGRPAGRPSESASQQTSQPTSQPSQPTLPPIPPSQPITREGG